MCGRYASFLPAEALARMFGTVNPLPNIDPSWNLAPSQPSLVARRQPETGDRHLDVLRWGLLPYFTTDAKAARRPINARAETVSTSGMYRGAFARRRCLVPLHNRMPVVVDPKDWPAWLGEVEADPTTLLEPPPAGTLRAWPVSRNVNSPRNNSAELLEPIQA